jgi:uncharacterized protein YjeT (DUF2065 family)
MKFLLCAFGLVFIIEGLPYFAFPEKMKRMLLKLQTVPESALRILGFLALIAGLALVYFGTSIE